VGIPIVILMGFGSVGGENGNGVKMSSLFIKNVVESLGILLFSYLKALLRVLSNPAVLHCWIAL
jgi:hypothetical protein